MIKTKQSNDGSRIDVAGPAEIAQLIKQADDFLIVSHMRPDGDCLGSTIGLAAGLLSLGKRVAAYNASPLTEKWSFLEGIGLVSNDLPDWNPQSTIFVDCGSIDRVRPDFSPKGKVINIDHHLTNTRFGEWNYIDIDACAVGEQIHALLHVLDVEITPQIAGALYLSIMTDTGSFRYSNTSGRAFKIAGDLVEAGANVAELAQAVFESRSREEVALMAKAYTSLTYDLDGTFAWAELRKADYEAHGGYENEPEGLSSDLRGVEGVEVSCLMHEMPDGSLRAGFRGKGKVDCASIAGACGGGGHFNAAGAHLKGGTYEELRAKVLQEVEKGVKIWRSEEAS